MSEAQPRKSPLLSVAIEADQLAYIEEYRWTNRVNRSQAVRELLAIGIAMDKRKEEE